MIARTIFADEQDEPPDSGDEPFVPPSPCADKITAFRHRFFPEVSETDWNNWRWQISHRIEHCDQLEQLVTLTDNERNAFQFQNATLPLAITPYYASLIDPDNPDQPIRRAMVPVAAELLVSPGEAQDPLGEDSHSPVKGLIHRYPDRVLFLVTDYCSSYCRYCTRSRMVGKRKSAGKQQWQRAIDYIAAHPEVRDVLISGGDPLTLSDGQLDWLLGKLRAIDHVELIRIGTKVPMVLPQRITPALVKVLKRYHPLWISIHCMHPDELTFEARRACTMLADAGIPLGSQTVLLSGINDTVGTMKRLMHELVKIRVKPYYLYQCDPIVGSSHFRTSVARGLEIYQGLRGHTTGYAVPTYVIDAPGGGGKIPLLPETMLGWEGNDLLLRNYEGRVFRYPDQFAGCPGRTDGEVAPCV
ncbi:KamA family radical SAM protein [Desulfofustis glycolicus]|uniref:L-lysine 2,3-aminomutase n=1 Tax=Desulfofustis glycolicus DSM 9705 TaxID=1121409 RepID=A0A1M5YDV8_9BACT|nr:KamA family radical SAM protein [Desulfofustis glycolicus]MCB2216916.1 KamA family radical SAM protein [Desulfobulbaceae bacterium]SHI10250.1 L-lysine 2,3-aminomutase [Desulfofustis glycolicus DSM 9705]